MFVTDPSCTGHDVRRSDICFVNAHGARLVKDNLRSTKKRQAVDTVTFHRITCSATSARLSLDTSWDPGVVTETPKRCRSDQKRQRLER